MPKNIFSVLICTKDFTCSGVKEKPHLVRAGERMAKGSGPRIPMCIEHTQQRIDAGYAMWKQETPATGARASSESRSEDDQSSIISSLIKDVAALREENKKFRAEIRDLKFTVYGGEEEDDEDEAEDFEPPKSVEKPQFDGTFESMEEMMYLISDKYPVPDNITPSEWSGMNFTDRHTWVTKGRMSNYPKVKE